MGSASPGRELVLLWLLLRIILVIIVVRRFVVEVVVFVLGREIRIDVDVYVQIWLRCLHRHVIVIDIISFFLILRIAHGLRHFRFFFFFLPAFWFFGALFLFLGTEFASSDFTTQ